MNRWIAVPIVGVAMALAGSAGAQPDGATPRDPAAAQALFEKGLRLLKDGDWKAGCPAFDASMKLDPSAGTQVNVARCYAHDGQVARAWAAFKQAKVLNRETAGDKRKKEVDAFVDEQIAALEPRLPWITVRVAARPDRVRVERDGAAIPVEGLDQRVPIDPGKHTFTVSAPGYRSVTQDVDMVEGQSKELVFQLEKDPSAVAPIEHREVADDPTRPTTPPAKPNTLLIVGGVVGGFGILTLAASAITGGLAYSDRSSLDQLVADRDCDEANGQISCNDAAKSAAHDALARGEPLALASTITLFAGAAIAATGLTCVILGVTRGSADSRSAWAVPLVLPAGAGLAIGGSL